MNQSGQTQNLFKEDILQANRASRLTKSQQVKLTVRMMLGNAIQVLIGIITVYIGLSVLSSDRNLMLILLLFAFALTFLVRGIQGWGAYFKDRRTGVQQVTGTVTVSMQNTSKTSDRGIASFSRRYYLHIRSHGSDATILTFPIERSLYNTTSNTQQDTYTLYYLRESTELLSFE